MVDMNSYENPADQLAEECDREHDRRDGDCTNCDIRATIQHCEICGADHVDGRWYTALGSTTPNGCDHEAIVDDWDREIVCTVMVTKTLFTYGEDVVGGTVRTQAMRRCGDSVTTPGRDACDFHARWQDADECARIYQRLVAAS